MGHQAGMGSKEWILVIFISVLTLDAVFCTWNPYQVLGLTRTATIPDIRKAYKSLAKEW